MRNLLAAAAALAPLVAATGVQAQVVVSTARTTPIQTSNANNGAAADVRITSGGSVSVNTGVAVAVDSSNSLTTEAGTTITMANAADGATAVLISGGTSGTVSIGGSILVSDSLDTATDTDRDGDADGPFAAGRGRYGVRLAGSAPRVGAITIENGSAIQVEGADSFGVSLEAPVTGAVSALGVIRAIGDRSTGVGVSAPVSGAVRIGGSVAATGEGARGVVIGGDVGGRVTAQGEIVSTGFRFTTRPGDRPEGFTETSDNDAGILFLDELDADDLLIGGAAFTLSGDVGGGLVFDIAPAYVNGLEGDDDGDTVRNGDEDDDADGTLNRNDTDRDGDGVIDTAEGASSITSFGSAAAVQIGAAGETTRLSVAGADAQAFGLINRGQIVGNGVYDGVDANALVMGGTGQTVVIDGGVRNDGTIATLALDANATTVRFGAGVTTPQFVNSANISSGVASELATTRSTAIQIDAGASLPSFTNSGSILATSGGGTATVTGLLDASGSLRAITNTGSIQANLVSNEASDPITGSATAIDVSANTTGVTLVQSGRARTPTTSDPDTDGDGVPDSIEPGVVGAIRFGSGADVMDIRNGSVAGDVSFGAGADRLTISGGAVVRGALSDSDGLLDIDVQNGVLDARQSAPLAVTGLTVGANGDLLVNLDPASRTNSGFRVNGAADIAAGAGLGIRFTSLLDGPQRFTIIDADRLTIGAIDQAAVQANSPYLFVTSAGADVAAGDVFIDARRRTAAEADFIRVEAEAFDAFYGALGDNDVLRGVFLEQTGRDGFINLYEQMLPDHSGGPLLSLASGVDAVTRALTGRNASAAPGESSAWLQEINFYADKDKTDTYGFRSEGFGVAGGVERGTDLGAFGLSLAFTSSDLEDPEAEAEEVLSANLVELGLYWRAQGQYWTTWARAAGGYASFDATRALVGEGLNLRNESSWHGLTLALGAGASYERAYGRVTLRPEAYVEYFGLSEDDRSEEGAGDGFDLDIDSRDGHLFSATAAMNLGYSFGDSGWLRPELRLGWRQNISVDTGDTIARFASGGPDFRLTGGSIEGGGPIAGVRLAVGNALGMFTVSADAEMIENYVRYALLLRASFRF